MRFELIVTLIKNFVPCLENVKKNKREILTHLPEVHSASERHGGKQLRHALGGSVPAK